MYCLKKKQEATAQTEYHSKSVPVPIYEQITSETIKLWWEQVGGSPQDLNHLALEYYKTTFNRIKTNDIFRIFSLDAITKTPSFFFQI